MKALAIEFAEYVNSNYNKTSGGWVDKETGSNSKMTTYTTEDLWNLYIAHSEPEVRKEVEA